jgi:protein-disulfide isomerase
MFVRASTRPTTKLPRPSEKINVIMRIKPLFTLAGALALVAGAVSFAQTAAPAADPFPPVNPKFFDAPAPTAAEVDSFLKAIWGYDSNRSWRVEAVQKTAAPGVSKVTIFVADKSQGNKVESVRFYVTPDNKYAIADTVFRFGARPFDDNAKLLEAEANGPAQGSAAKKLLIVEFADLQCPHCKEALPTMENLHKDYPDARIVFQNYPLTSIHPFAYKAAAMGNCVAAAMGDTAFFAYTKNVFDHQESLTDQLAEQTMKNAVIASGADPIAIATCAASPAAKAKLDGQIALAEKLGVDQTPMIAVNGHLMPLGGLPYETLKQVIDWDVKQSGK